MISRCLVYLGSIYMDMVAYIHWCVYKEIVEYTDIQTLYRNLLCLLSLIILFRYVYYSERRWQTMACKRTIYTLKSDVSIFRQIVGYVLRYLWDPSDDGIIECDRTKEVMYYYQTFIVGIQERKIQHTSFHCKILKNGIIKLFKFIGIHNSSTVNWRLKPKMASQNVKGE